LVRVFIVVSVLTAVVLCIAYVSMFRPFAGGGGGGGAATSARSRIESAAMAITPAPEPTNASAAGAAVRRDPPRPYWIWSSEAAQPLQQAFFRKRFQIDQPIRRASIRVSCDNRATVRLNGAVLGEPADWMRVEEFDASGLIRAGENEVTIDAANQGGPAGLLGLLEVVAADGTVTHIVTDSTWECAAAADFASSGPAKEVAAYGSAPWGELAGFLTIDVDRQIAAVDGFVVELVYAVPRSLGSWVAMTTDAKGRLIASDQQAGLFRVTPSAIGEDASSSAVAPIDSPAGAAQGLLCVDDALYAVSAGGRAQGAGLYRLRDTDGDDVYDDTTLLRAMEEGGEHGPHAVVCGPDGMLYIVAGNHTPLPNPERSLVPRHWGEDHLLPRIWDPRGHAVGIMAPGGWICRTDLDGATWEVFSVGYRNSYDIAFNPEGDLFTYDSDMEWEMGAPWYRPTRLMHATSGSEFGWRSGSAKWPAHYADSLPAMLDIGPGSPTGVVFGTGAKFPAKYQHALFALDWTYGTIYAVHLSPNGSTYAAEREVFVSGRPLPVADAVVHPIDGSLYFLVGGRGVPSAIYRVRYIGDEATEPAMDGRPASDIVAARSLRRQLERFHGVEASDADLDFIWARLGHADRFMSYAARIALEHQPVQRWVDRMSAETDPKARLIAAIALARCGNASSRRTLLDSLRATDWDDLDRESRLTLLRAWALAIIRGGKPEASEARRIAASFERVYPAGDDQIDRELCDLLVALDSPVVVARTIPLMERMETSAEPFIDPSLLGRNDTYGSVILKMAAANPQQQQVHYAMSLRHATRGWNDDLRERYFRWFEAVRDMSGGLSFADTLEVIRREALANVPEVVRARYETLGAPAELMGLADVPNPRGPGRSWTIEDLTVAVQRSLKHRDFANGRAMFDAALCGQCHRFAGGGKTGGPDLTAVATRYTLRDLVESMVEPSRTISDQYHQTEFVLKDDSVVVGRVVARDEVSVTVLQSLLTPDFRTTIPAADIASERVSAVSAMTPGLLNRLGDDEVFDLFAYLLAEGDPRSSMFLQPDADGFASVFDGRSLDGWEGDRRFWSAANGEIIGRTTSENPAPHNTFLVWRGTRVGDFELRAEVRLIGDNNSGIQYRAREVGEPGAFQIHGYQCDIHANPPYTAMLYEEGGRGIIAERGSRVRINPDGSKSPLVEDGSSAPPSTPAPIDLSEWREYTIVAVGNRIEHRIDGEVTVVVEDGETAKRSDHGVIGLQIHSGSPYEVRFRNIRLKRLD
jgi:putative heme-binding domain-containing protein